MVFLCCVDICEQKRKGFHNGFGWCTCLCVREGAKGGTKERA